MVSSDKNTIKYNDAAAYDAMMGVWSQLLGSQFISWLKPVSNKKWIDIRCGSGAYTEQIFNFCDISDSVLKNRIKVFSLVLLH